MKKLITLICLTLILTLSASIIVSAEEIDASETTQEKALRRQDRSTAVADKIAEREAQKAAAVEKQAAAKERLLLIVDEHAPELTDDFQVAYSNHLAVHEALEALQLEIREEKKSSLKAEFEALRSDIKAQIEDGSLDRDGARILLTAAREETKASSQADREALKAEIESLKVTYNQSKETRQSLQAALKAAIETNDSAATTEALEAIYQNLLNHIDFDEAKLDLFLNNFVPSV